jgi:hypothetical protein
MKKYILLCLIYGASLQHASPQQKAGYFVAYTYKQKSEIPDSVKNKKMNVEVKYINDTSVSNEITESSIGQILTGSLNFELPVYIIANIDSSKMFFESDGDFNSNEKKGISINVSTPDTIYYKKDEWRKLNEGDSPIPVVSFDVLETKEKKVILGYECIKFVLLDNSKKEQIIFWASKGLPNTLLPYTGLKKFKYGILEIDHKRDKWHTVATRIKKL